MNERPQSEKLIELHVYVIPSILWQDQLRSAVNQIISDTISAGFIRVRPDSNLICLREEIVKQLGDEIIPRQFIFCKSVGRCLAQVGRSQEKLLKAYHFLPPNSYCPELFLLDSNAASRSTPSLTDSSKFTSITDEKLAKTPHSNYSDIYNNNDYNFYNDESNSEAVKSKQTHSTPKNQKRSLKNDYFSNDTSNKIASNEHYGSINLNDYPNLTSEEIRMLQSMSDSEIMEYLQRNGHIQPNIHYSYGNASQNNTNPGSMYEEDGPQRSLKQGNSKYGVIPKVNVEDVDMMNDSHMSDLEKYQYYMKLLEKYQNQRMTTESRREDLIRKAKNLYTKTANQKNIARDMWRKKYFEEKKRNPPLEDHLGKQRNELDSVHRKIFGIMEGYVKDNRVKDENQKSIDVAKMRLMSKKLEYDIEEAQRKVDEAKLKLTCEMKLTHQARAEIVALRADLVQKKINLTTTRNQQLSSMGTQDINRPNTISLVKPVN